MTWRERARVLREGVRCKIRPAKYERRHHLPKSSEVLTEQLRQRGYPHWTAWYVPYCSVSNDLWGKSHFNHDVDGRNYQVLRTGAFPFVKFHCSLREESDLWLEDRLFGALKIANFGIPTLLYGLAGLALARHEEIVRLSGGRRVRIYFWYRETRAARF